MDILHHTLIGGAGYLVANRLGHPVAGALFVAASVLPDLDALFMVLGKRFYLRHHQGISHSLVLSPLYAYLLCLPFLYFLDTWWVTPFFLAAWAGLLLHIMLDWSNTFRIALLAPFSRQRSSLDTLFFIDTPSWLLTLGFYAHYQYGPFPDLLYLYPLLFSLYLIGKTLIRQQVIKQLQPAFAIPSSLNPFAFYILEPETGEGVSNSYHYNLLTNQKTDPKSYPAITPHYQQLAQQSRLFCDMHQVTRAFRITQVVQKSTGFEIHAADLAVRNFGGRFAKTVLTFDPQDRLIHEVANI